MDRTAFLEELRSINTDANRPWQDCCLAGVIGRAIELLDLPADQDLLAALPQLIQHALAQAGQYEDEKLDDLRREYAQRNGQREFPDFETLHGSADIRLLTILRMQLVIADATGDAGIAAELSAALRASQFVAERYAVDFCFGWLYPEATRLVGTCREGVFGETTMRIQRSLDDYLLTFTRRQKWVAFSRNSATGVVKLESAFGNVTPDTVADMLAEVLSYWLPDRGFYEVSGKPESA